MMNKMRVGDVMTYTCIACSEDTMGLFFGKEKALFHLFELSEEQRAVFLYSFVSYDLISRCLKYYSNDLIEILGNAMYYQKHWVRILPYSIETSSITANILFDYMKKYHKIWCCRDENGHVIWLKGCQVIENCVK